VAHILAQDPARELPLYIDGFHAGQDVGLMIALNAIVAEQTRQDDAWAVAAVNPRTADTARHVYCAARLYDVAVVVAARFRQ
jgi:hypothetical protein